MELSDPVAGPREARERAPGSFSDGTRVKQPGSGAAARLEEANEGLTGAFLMSDHGACDLIPRGESVSAGGSSGHVVCSPPAGVFGARRRE